MTTDDLHAIAAGTDKRHSPWHEAQELAQEVLSLRAEVEAAKRLASGFAEEYKTAQAELAACRHDLQTCAEKLATASGHLGIVAARQPERFWTRKQPKLGVGGWFWWRSEQAGPTLIWVCKGPVLASEIPDHGEFCGPLQSPTMTAPE